MISRKRNEDLSKDYPGLDLQSKIFQKEHNIYYFNVLFLLTTLLKN